MTKELLSKRGIEFESLDVENDPAALAALKQLGLSTVPVVAVGDRFVHGWNPPKIAELVGFDLKERIFPPEEQIRALEMLFDAALRAVRQVPDECLTMKSPDRDRKLRELTHHIFRILEVAVDADAVGDFPAKAWLAGKDVPSHTSSERIARYGEAALAKFRAWYRTIDPAAFSRIIETDVGPRSLAQIMERTKSHAGQHVRQLYVFLGWMNIEPDRPLTEADFKDIDLPEALW